MAALLDLAVCYHAFADLSSSCSGKSQPVFFKKLRWYCWFFPPLDCTLCVVGSPGWCLGTVNRICFVFLKSKLRLKVNVWRMVEVRVSFLWTCIRMLYLLTSATDIPCPRQLFLTSHKASAPSSNSSNTDRSVWLSISSARHSTCCSCFQAAYLVISQPSG